MEYPSGARSISRSASNCSNTAFCVVGYGFSIRVKKACVSISSTTCSAVNPIRAGSSSRWYAVPRGREGMWNTRTRPSGCITSSMSTRKPTAVNNFSAMSIGSRKASVPTTFLGGRSLTPGKRMPPPSFAKATQYLYSLALSYWFFASLNSSRWCSEGDWSQRSICAGVLAIKLPSAGHLQVHPFSV